VRSRESKAVLAANASPISSGISPAGITSCTVASIRTRSRVESMPSRTFPQIVEIELLADPAHFGELDLTVLDY
jgi:hypothetical protein